METKNQERSLVLSKVNHQSQRITPLDLTSHLSFQIEQKKKRPTYKKNYKPIVINLEGKNRIMQDTRYEVIERVCEELGWRLDFCCQNHRDWDIKWTDSYITPDVLAKMSSHQKINHFPGMITLFRKNNLARNLRRMQNLSEEHYDFFPRTFLLPHDATHFRSYMEDIRKKNITKTFIVKPEANSQGRGIYLTQDVQDIDTSQHCVVQKYISNPLLYKGLKFDLRIYVLVAGCDPLRIYIYNEGLVRFATQKYQFPNSENIQNMCMHLTNYAINKSNPNYVFNDSTENLSQGHKKSLAQFFRTLKAIGLKANCYWASIKDIVIKTLIAGQPHLQHQYRVAQPQNLVNNMCFEVLGFDFMIEGNHNCSLLQINHTPSFSTDTPLDDLVKSNLIRDTLLLMNINEKARQSAVSEAKEIQQKRVLTGKVNKLTPQQRMQRIQQLQNQRQNYERQNLGSYERIFPSKNTSKQAKYEQLIKISAQSYRQESSGIKSSHRISPSKKITSQNFRLRRMQTSETVRGQDDSTSAKVQLSKTPNLTKVYTNSVDPKLHLNQAVAAITAFALQKGRSLDTKTPQSALYDLNVNKNLMKQLSQNGKQKCLNHLVSRRMNYDMILPTNNSSFTMFSKQLRETSTVPGKPIIK